MKTIILFLISAVMVASCGPGQASNDSQGSAGNYITISGTVGFPQQGLILLEEYQGSENITTVIDTFALDDENYTFSEKVKIERPGYYKLNFYHKQAVNLILHKDDIQVNVDGNTPNGYAQITGSSDIDFIREIQELNQSFQSSEEIRSLNDEFMQANQSGDSEKMDELRAKYMQLEKEMKQEMVSKIEAMGVSLGVLEVLRGGRILDKDQYFSVYERFAESLKKEMPNVGVAKEFITEVEQMKKLAIGQLAPDISLPNPEGEVVSLSSLRGNYVLVDFWAKWCKPCRMENPNVVKMYQKYNDQGFEVFGVSLDRRREDWLQAIEEDELHWTQVSDLKYWKSEAARLYNINAIPFALLLDPDGRIIGKNLRGRQLENKLEEIFGKG